MKAVLQRGGGRTTWSSRERAVQGGCYQVGDSRLYPGYRLAAESNAVVVTIHYRLATLAWLGTEALVESGDVNRAFLDQQLALRWAHANVAAFGGDPSRLLVFGQSAGGGSTAAQLLLAHKNPAERLFSAAAMESPDTMDDSGAHATACQADLSSWAACSHRRRCVSGECTFMPKAENLGLSRDFAHSVGCELGDDEQLLKCLHGVNSSAFQQSAPQGSLFPMVDGLQFERWPADLFAHGLFADVPVIIGSTALENARDACTIVMLSRFVALRLANPGKYHYFRRAVGRVRQRHSRGGHCIRVRAGG